MSVELISTTEAARLAGVGTSSIKRWADEGRLVCRKTAGGHRRFARDEVERVLRGGRDPDGWIERLLRGDAVAVEGALLEDRSRRGSWHAVCDGLGGVLVELGLRWQRGELSVLQEHLISERLARALGRLGDGLPLRPGAPRALLATADPADEHTLGLALAELTLREAGWRTAWAGRRTPAAELAAAAHDDLVDLVVLSASVVARDRRVLGRVLGAVTRTGVRVVVGGGGAWPDPPPSAARFHDFGSFSRWLGV